MLLYIHIPFCDSKCHYCNFNSFVNREYLQIEYFKSLLKQLKFEIERFNLNSLESIYIGGGTPSSIDAKLFEPIFRELRKYISNSTEITIEANPNSISKEWLESIQNFGINRISFGVQSFNDRKLKLLGRVHSSKEAIESIELTKRYFQNISIDLIYNLKVDSIELLREDLELVNKLEIEHLSSYSLTLESGTKFENRDRLLSKDENLEIEFIDMLKSKFTQYEISNYTKGYKSIHNLGYWMHKNYIGVGSGAVGFLDNKRLYPNRDLNSYIENPLNIEIEFLSSEDLRLERIFLGFRSEIGVSLSEFENLERINNLIENQKLLKKGKRVYNPNYLLADELTLYLS